MTIKFLSNKKTLTKKILQNFLTKDIFAKFFDKKEFAKLFDKKHSFIKF